MKITFEQFEEYLTKFLELREGQLIWESKLPEDLVSLYDNTYVNNMGLQLDLTMELLFGDSWLDVQWFLYDCMGSENIKSMKNNVQVEGRNYSIKDLASYLEYAKKELVFLE